MPRNAGASPLSFSSLVAATIRRQCEGQPSRAKSLQALLAASYFPPATGRPYEPSRRRDASRNQIASGDLRSILPPSLIASLCPSVDVSHYASCENVGPGPAVSSDFSAVDGHVEDNHASCASCGSAPGIGGGSAENAEIAVSAGCPARCGSFEIMGTGAAEATEGPADETAGEVVEAELVAAANASAAAHLHTLPNRVSKSSVSRSTSPPHSPRSSPSPLRSPRSTGHLPPPVSALPAGELYELVSAHHSPCHSPTPRPSSRQSALLHATGAPLGPPDTKSWRGHVGAQVMEGPGMPRVPTVRVQQLHACFI